MANPDAARVAPKNFAKRQKHFEEGHNGALLDAIAVAAFAGVPLPEWAAEAFLKSYHDVVTRKLHRSWDEVFGEPHGKGKHLPAMRRKDALAGRVFKRVQELRQRKSDPVKIGDGMWEIVGDEMGIAAGRVKEYYYFAIDEYVLAPGKPVPGIWTPWYLKSDKTTSGKNKKA